MFKCASQYKVSKKGRNYTNEVNSHSKNGKQGAINNKNARSK